MGSSCRSPKVSACSGEEADGERRKRAAPEDVGCHVSETTTSSPAWLFSAPLLFSHGASQYMIFREKELASCACGVGNAGWFCS
jgi:hypothetical protein